MARRSKQVREISAEQYLELQLSEGSEADFQQWLVREAREHGWLVFYLPDWMFRLAMASMKRRRRADRPWPDKGFPDVWCVHPERGKLVVFECKRNPRNARTSPEQDRWIQGLRKAGIDARVARPRHIASIRKVLQG